MIESVVDIEAGASAVWAVLADVERWPDWTASMTSVTLLDEEPVAAGSRARVVQPKLRPSVWTVTEFEPGRVFAWASTNAGVTTVGGHYLARSANGGTTVRLTFTMSGLLAPIVGALMGGTVRRYVQLEADGLKRRSEAAA